MATTSPDNIRTPDSGDQYALVQDLGLMADSVQDALNVRGNFYIGTSSQRTAFTSAPDGVNWQDTNGQMGRYKRVAGAWILQGDGYYYGTTAQRTAAGALPNGVQWQDTNGDQILWTRQGGEWVDASAKRVVPLTSAMVGSGWTLSVGYYPNFTVSAGRVYVKGLLQRNGGAITSMISGVPVDLRPSSNCFIGTACPSGQGGVYSLQCTSAGTIGIFSSYYYGALGSTGTYFPIEGSWDLA